MFLNKIKKLTQSFTYTQIFFWIIGVVSLRVGAEWLLLDFPIELDVFQDYVRFYLENIYYFLIIFIVGAVFISKIVGKQLLDVMRFGVRFYPIILLPPLIDRLILGQTTAYKYATIPNLGGNFWTLSFLWGDASVGVSIEILLALCGVLWYVYRNTKSFWKSLGTFLFMDVLLVLISTPDLFFGEGFGDYYYDIFIPFYYCIPFLFLLLGVMALYRNDKMQAMIINLRPIRSLIFVMAVGTGGWVRSLSSNDLYEGYLFFNAFAIFLVWQVSVFINDIFDMDIDRLTNPERPLIKGIVTPDEYKLAGILLSFIAMSLTIVIKPVVFLMIVVSIFLAYSYSAPPLRLRKTLLGNLVIGLSLAISFWAGLFSSDDPYVFHKRHVFLGVLLFIIGTVISLSKDIKDVEGDKQCGIDNLFTSYGKAKGKLITSFCIFAALSIPAVLFVSLAIFILSLIAVFLYYKFETIQGVYLCSLAVILIVILNLYYAPNPMF
ncbi:hypothetical protein MNBD_UNCLBAC01-1306 [hydrothermal vent metagenome]|uniref:Uncharacterized protein n=1 Tax=hydrothermal vent metagenome TaxID=652676 RepID=A0A3B1D7X0_9ZZZZ